mgnify:CR=1 FL=1
MLPWCLVWCSKSLLKWFSLLDLCVGVFQSFLKLVSEVFELVLPLKNGTGIFRKFPKSHFRKFPNWFEFAKMVLVFFGISRNCFRNFQNAALAKNRYWCFSDFFEMLYLPSFLLCSCWNFALLGKFRSYFSKLRKKSLKLLKKSLKLL